MSKLVLSGIFVLAVFVAGCDSSDDDGSDSILVGTNFELTGDLPDVGTSARNAAEMFTEEINANGGVLVAGRKLRIELVAADNQATPQGALAAADRLITEDNVLVMVGPNPSNAAVEAGAVANALETPMISPWSTNPNTTLNRPWVFRVPFLDTFQGPVLVNFALTQYAASTACVLYDVNNDYSRGLAESFENAWEEIHGSKSIRASETFSTGETDFTAQLTRIGDSGCDVIFTPQYAHEVPTIVSQAKALYITEPILGSDSWGGATLIEECGSDCEGLFFSAHYVPEGATGATKTFIDAYKARDGSVPSDVAALTSDAMLLVGQAVKNCGELTGNLAQDRSCIRSGMASMKNFEGITGTSTFGENGDPIKCA